MNVAEEVFRVVAPDGNLAEARAVAHEGGVVARREACALEVVDFVKAVVVASHEIGGADAVVGIGLPRRDERRKRHDPVAVHAQAEARARNEDVDAARGNARLEVLRKNPRINFNGVGREDPLNGLERIFERERRFRRFPKRDDADPQRPLLKYRKGSA